MHVLTHLHVSNKINTLKQRRIVTDYLQNAEHNKTWLKKKEMLLKDSEELNQRLPSLPQRRKRELRTMMASNYKKNEISSGNRNAGAHATSSTTSATFNDENDDQTVLTYGTMATNGTLHRRRNSTSIFTVDSLARIFNHENQNEYRPKDWDESTIGDVTTPKGHQGIVPETVRKFHRDTDADEQSLISPLGDNEDSVGNIHRFDDTKYIASLVE